MAEEKQLALIRFIHSLTTLIASVHDRDSWETLCTTLGTLPCLTDLTLALRGIKSVPAWKNNLNLPTEKLKMDALFLREFWTIVENLPSLRRLSLKGSPRGVENTSFLRYLDEVELCSRLECSASLAAKIGEPVRKLVILKPQGLKDIMKLHNCWKLRDLHICIFWETYTTLNHLTCVGKQ